MGLKFILWYSAFHIFFIRLNIAIRYIWQTIRQITIKPFQSDILNTIQFQSLKKYAMIHSVESLREIEKYTYEKLTLIQNFRNLMN